MMILSAVYVQAHQLPKAISVFAGLKCIVVAIVANAVVSFGRSYLKDWQGILIAFVSAGLFGLGGNPILVILCAALLGLVLNKRQVPVSPGTKVRFARSLLLILAAAAAGFALLFFVERRLFDLAAIMLRIDLFAFGGGFASVPLMLHQIVDVRSWMDAPTFLDGIALGQVTPGPIVITATFVGYLLHGPIGGVVATLSVFLPSFVIVVGIAPYFDRLRSSPYFHKGVGGILCSFVGLLFTVAVRFGANMPWDVPRIGLAAAALAALLLRVDILWVVLAGTIISIFCF
jgi:chromate transporter